MLLRSVWNEPRPPDPPARVRRDWALVGALAPLAVLEGVLRSPPVFWTALTVGLLPTLLWRRTRPLLALSVGWGVTGLAALVVPAPDSYTLAYFLILPYALFRWGSGREALLGLPFIALKVGVAMATGRLDIGQMVGGLAVVSSTMALGAAFRYRARARMREFERVKLIERESLARDLHDTVAHHVSAIAIRAQAGLAVAPTHPAAAAEALKVIEAEATRALAEMRAMVRVLRRDDPAVNPGRSPRLGAERAPNPRVADLAELTGRDGLPVDLGISGDVDDLPPSVGAAIYRLAQESVTNARRHARHATRVEVRVAADDTAVHLRVSDDGDANPGASPGYGLRGMFERAGLLGGVCEAGPNAGRGWTVTATLPRVAP